MCVTGEFMFWNRLWMLVYLAIRMRGISKGISLGGVNELVLGFYPVTLNEFLNFHMKSVAVGL